MNITLRDLVRWPDSPVRPAVATGTSAMMPEAGLLAPDREVSWPVTLRATPPMLPHVEEGTLVLLPRTTLAEVGASLPGALRELRRRGVIALVVDDGTAIAVDNIDLLLASERVGPNLEATLTRLLNTRRARLYRHGTEIDRALTEATLRGQGVARLLAIGTARGERDLLLLDERGRVAQASWVADQPTGETPPRPPAPPLGVDTSLAPLADPLRGDEWLLCPLGGPVGGWIALRGPLGRLDEGDRLLGQRVAAACTLSLSREATTTAAKLAPARRAALAAELLLPNLPERDRLAHAEALELNPDAAYAVLLVGGRDDQPGQGRASHALRRTLVTRLTTPAGGEPFEIESPAATGLLLHAPTAADLQRLPPAVRPAVARDPGHCLAALSTVVTGLSAAPAAGRQARFALALLRRGTVAGPLLDWNAPNDLGPYALLYHLWGTPDAARFVEAVLGGLPDYDERYGGDLVATLAAYLRHSGGAAAAATELAIHRNTLTYRLRRITELIGRSPLDPAQQLSLHLAVLLHGLPPAE